MLLTEEEYEVAESLKNCKPFSYSQMCADKQYYI
jgi:hypothetical protein